MLVRVCSDLWDDADDGEASCHSTSHMEWLQDSNGLLSVTEPREPQGPGYLAEGAGDKRPAVDIAVGFTNSGQVGRQEQPDQGP